MKTNKSALKTREEDLSSLQGRLERFKDFEELKKKVTRLATDEKNCRDLLQEISLLASYESILSGIHTSIGRLEAIKNVRIPNFSECEESEKELEWIRIKEADLRAAAELVKRLRDVKKIDLPETNVTEKLIQEVPEIIRWDNSLSDFTKKINNLELIEKISIPDTGKLETLLKDLSQIVNWDDKVTGSSKNLEAQKGLLDSLSIDNLVGLSEKTGTILAETTEVSKLYASFFESASQTKIARDDLKKVTEDLSQAQHEKDQIKVCPACERPF